MKWKFNPSIKNGPAVIDYSSFEPSECFLRFKLEEGKTSHSISVKDQCKWLDEIKETISERDFGWQVLVCGPDVEQLRLFAYSIASAAVENSKSEANWVNIPSYRSTTLFDLTDVTLPQTIVLDSLLIFPERATFQDGKAEFPSYVHDFVRTANIFDVCSKARGSHNTIVLAPGVSPDLACKLSYLKPNYMFQFGN